MFKDKISYLRIALSFIFILSSFTSFSQEKSKIIQTINGKKYFIHKVDKSQSLYAIAKLYNCDINILLAENDEAIDGLKNGQELKIPVNPGAITKPVPVYDSVRYVYHRVAKKETVFSICKLYNITEKKLWELNPEVFSAIKPGQMLIVAEKQKPIVVNVIPKDSVVKISKPKKTKYNVALFLPFKLSELDLIDVSSLVQNKAAFPQMQSLSVDFYLGFKKAIDSLSAKDFEINLLLFDSDDKDSLNLETTCKTTEFKSLDLIFGPLYASGFKIVSSNAKTLNIPVISPFTQQNKILFKNNYASKVSPSQFTMLESLADYCIDSLRNNARFFIINDGAPKDAQYIKAFKQRFNQHLKELNLPTKDSVFEVKGLAGFKINYTPSIKNVVILLTNNPVFLSDFITQLSVYKDKKDIMLAGWQNVVTFENIDHEYLNELSYTFPSQNNLTALDSYTLLIKDYQQQMSSDPGDYYYFQGFDIAQYYLQNLKNIGPDFVIALDKLPFDGNYTRFKFYRPDEFTGFENKGVYIFKYNNYQLQNTLWR